MATTPFGPPAGVSCRRSGRSRRMGSAVRSLGFRRRRAHNQAIGIGIGEGAGKQSMTRTETGSDPRTARRKLPIGIQTFRTIREDGSYYVDKSAYVQRLVDEGTHYFLSRPRRFGKSLLLDTLKELFEGSEELFRGLAVHDRWDWSVRRPVLRLDFGAGDFEKPDYLREEVAAQFEDIETQAGISPGEASAPIRFRRLIRALHERAGRRVAILVDEYDKPILDALASPEVARANRNFLRGLYSAIKQSDAHVKFTLLTGVSRFSKVSIFSGLNNLRDITLDPRYSSICGYTDADLDAVFAPELPGLDRDEIRRWYNGYCWLGEEKVYNPFDILLLFGTRKFKAHWFETGTPTFLIDALLKRKIDAATLEDRVAGEALLSAFDVDRIATEALLFQTGYLTITGEDDLGGEPVYRLGYPNHEVRRSLNESLLRAMAPEDSRQTAALLRLRRLLGSNDFDGLEALFRSFFAGIPYEWHTKNDIARYEGYYASVFYSCFAAAGLDVRVEDSTSRGRLDMAVLHDGHVYVFECKTVEKAPEGKAMAQIKEKGYADKYRHLGRPIHLIGVEFSREDRNVAAFEVERAA